MLTYATVFTIGIIALVAAIFFRLAGKKRYTVTWKRGGLLPKSLCCNAVIKPVGWSQDGWIGQCKTCGSWQYLGDDFDNPPPGFKARDAAVNSKPYAEPSVGLSAASDLPKIWEGQGTEVTSEPKCLMFDCDQPTYQYGLCRDHLSQVEGIDDEGEPLRQTPPNIGGEGHPDYAGPHYDSAHGLQTRFAPYEMLGEPIPGTAVIRVGRTAAVGPIRTEGQGDEDTGTDKP